MQLDKHPILMKAYELTQAIEICGASEELTNAVIKSDDLGDDIEKLVDENKELKETAKILDERVNDLLEELRAYRNEL